MKTFVYLLSVVMALADENPGLTPEALLEEKAEALGLDESSIIELKDSFALIDSFSAKHKELSMVREAGGSRADFMAGQIGQMVGERSEEEQNALLSSLNDVSESIIKEATNN